MAKTNLRKFKEIILKRTPKMDHFRLIFIPVDPRINTRYANYSATMDAFRVIMDFEQRCLKGTFSLDFPTVAYKRGPLEGEIKRYVVPEYATNENKKS